MSLSVVEKAQSVIVESAPDCETELVLSKAVGIAIAMATPVDAVEITELNLYNRSELINKINGYEKSFQLISACNDVCLLCVETAVRAFTQAMQFRMQVAKGDARALVGVNAYMFDNTVSAAAGLMVDDFKAYFKN